MPLSDGYARPIALAVDEQVAQLTSMQRELDKELPRLLGRLDTKDGKLLAGQLRNASRVRQQVLDALRRIGVRPVVTTTQQAMAETADKIGQQAITEINKLSGQGFSFDANATPALEQIQRGYSKQIVDMFGVQSQRLFSEINAAIAGGVPMEQLIRRASERTGALVSQTTAIVDTAVSAAGRQALGNAARTVNQESEAIILVYEYGGPLDSLTRPFCRLHHGKILSQEYIDSTKNDNKLPMAETCGGYRCRHWLAPVLLGELAPTLSVLYPGGRTRSVAELLEAA